MLVLSSKIHVDALGSKLEYYKLSAFELTEDLSTRKLSLNYDFMLPLEYRGTMTYLYYSMRQ